MSDDDRFEILGTLGKGGMGTVFTARDRETGEVVAIKELHPMFVDDADYVARFEREVEVARRIHSPNVVSVLGYGRRDGIPYMVMEKVEGQSLRELLKERGRLSWEEAKPIITQVAEALRAAHRVGVIHRDIKPSNILVTPDGTVKLADFGIARATDLTRLTGGATMLGTPAYMAPENTPSFSSDLYGLGCVLYEMLGGQPPFNGQSQQEILIRHLRDRPDLNLIPAPARRIVAALLQKTPQRRPQSATALLMLLESDTGPTTPEATAATTKAEKVVGPRSASSNQKPAVVVAGVAIAVFLLLGLLLAQQCGSSDSSNAADISSTATAEATATQRATAIPPQPTTAPPTSVPPTAVLPTAPPPPAFSGPHVTVSNWSPANARFGDNIFITLTYSSGDAAITKVQLHEVGVNSDGTPVRWPSVENAQGISVAWTGDNYLVTTWDLPANTKSATFPLRLPCNGPKRFTSRLFITFIDSRDRRSESELSVSPICG